MRLVRKEKVVVVEEGEAVIAAGTAVAVVDAAVAADVGATVVEEGEAAIAAVTADATAKLSSASFIPNFEGAENSRASNERRAICVR
jgi:hypothetical protein